MSPEPIYISPELKKSLIRGANAANLTLDEYVASLTAEKVGPQPNGSSGAARTAPVSDARLRSRERLEEMQDMWMMRAASMGQPVPGMMGDAPNAALDRLNARFDKLEERLEARSATPANDELGLDAILRSVVKYRAMAPVIKLIGGDEDGTGPSKLQREAEKELRERIDKAQERFLAELREKDKELAGIRDAANQARVEDLKSVVTGLEDQIGTLSDRLQQGGPSQQGNVAEQLTAALTQASQVQQALTNIANANRPPAPTPGGEKNTVETIAYLANELSGAVSKGLEAVARVNAAQKGHNPDAIGHMPAPGAPPPVYRPDYPTAPPPRRTTTQGRTLRAQAGPPAAPAPPGMKMVFEGPRSPAPGPEVPFTAPSDEPPAEAPVSGPADELPPLDPNIERFLGPDGQPISREDYQALRLEVFRRTGRDPMAVYDTGGQRVDEPRGGSAPPSQEEAGGSTEPAEGTGDENPSESQ